MATVVADAISYVESLESVDGPHLPIEFGGACKGDTLSLKEWTAGTTSLDTPIEFLGAARRGTPTWAEFIATAAQLDIPIEWLSASAAPTVDGDAHSPIEVLSAARADALLRAELFGASVRLCFQIEFGYAVKSDERSPAEMLSLARADGAIAGEAASIQRSDPGISVEWAALVAVIADALLRLEFAASQRQDRIPFEFTGATVAGVENDSATPIESLTSPMRVNLITETESLWSIAADFNALTEVLVAARNDYRQAVESLATALRDAGLPDEWSGQPFVILNALIALETTALFRGDTTALVESGNVVSGNALTLAEALAAALVRLANIESVAGVLVDKGLPAETTGQLRWDTLAWGESLRSALLDASTMIEAIRSQVSDPPVPSEWQGHIQFIADALVAIEAAGLLRTDAAARGETITSALRDIVVLAEALRSQVGDQGARGETQGLVVGDVSTPAENLFTAHLVVDALLPTEAGFGVRADRNAIVEALASTLMDDRSLTLESAALFLANSNLPAELVGRLVTDTHPSAEWITLAGNVLADAGIPIEAEGATAMPLINIGRYLRSVGYRRILKDERH